MKPAAVPPLLALGFILPLTLPFAWQHSPALGCLALAATAAVHAPLLYGTLRPNSQLFGPVVTRFTPTRPGEIWLTVDDGPDPHDTPRLLDLLDAADARATFFVIGERALAHPELVREIVRRGHEVGNHTHTHPQATFWSLGPRRMAREINDCQRALQAITGAAPRLFRAPVGMANPFAHAAARKLNLTLTGWSARGFDGVAGADPEEVVRLILKDLHPGGIALLHEGRRGKNNDDAPNVRALGLLLAALKTRGWRAVLPPMG